MKPAVFEIEPPDLGPWRTGNTGTAGVWRFTATAPGRHVLLTALIHGNELCGAWALRDLLATGVRPRRGTLSLAFANLDAFDRFDPGDPHASRYVHTDMNRLWGELPWRRDVPAQGVEHRRVLELLPHVEASDWLLDLHSMHEPGPPLALVGPLPHQAEQARALGLSALCVADQGHRAGVRMRDHGRYGNPMATDAFALLLECGYHGAQSAVDVARDALARFLVHAGTLDRSDLPTSWWQEEITDATPLLDVTHAVTVAPGAAPRFAAPWRCGEVVEQAGTLIGWSGDEPVLTPYDRCWLVMPSLAHAVPGATLVRFARERAAP
ncbi:succinylglutamate desuccinylase/aspartoacylase domain-containing protein [Hydrogenophaga intermedia]|uniref:succinylglutamate desuccinylase/aspartoacylase domain-containing protein n=1 Tax=Hydrogenophaga intermedia TaxID=65786 RepID=UPI0020448D6D|nr:succinylglutamate desuccinylase/aspartoacylase family protein [Hydrogenophaga intermedia]